MLQGARCADRTATGNNRPRNLAALLLAQEPRCLPNKARILPKIVRIADLRIIAEALLAYLLVQASKELAKILDTIKVQNTLKTHSTIQGTCSIDIVSLYYGL